MSDLYNTLYQRNPNDFQESPIPDGYYVDDNNCLMPIPETETGAEDMNNAKNIKVNYTNFSGKRTSTTIRFSIANIYYRETNLVKYMMTILNREKHEKAVKNIIQEFVNTQHKEDDEEMSTWEDQDMIETAILEDIVFYSSTWKTDKK